MTELRLTAMKFLDRMEVLISPPRCHRHRYHGVLAPMHRYEKWYQNAQGYGSRAKMPPWWKKRLIL
nr:hypothetical protein [Rhodospirillales bacterium]